MAGSGGGGGAGGGICRLIPLTVSMGAVLDLVVMPKGETILVLEGLVQIPASCRLILLPAGMADVSWMLS